MLGVHFNDVEVRYGNVVAITDINLMIRGREFVVVLGPSGAGKTTLLKCINGFVKPVRGAVAVDGVDVGKADETGLRKIRRRIGVIYQQFNLIKRMNVLQNVLCGRLGHVNTLGNLFGSFSARDIKIAMACLRKVGMGHKMYQRADTLSGGEQQRVAIARALAQEPSKMLADEPVTNLDHDLAHHIMEILLKIWREKRITTLLSIHNLELVREYCSSMRLIGLNSGEVVYDGKVDELDRGALTRIYGGLDKIEL